MDKFEDECGVFGILNNNEEEVSTAEVIYFGLFALQHRGQEGAGIAVRSNGKIKVHKGTGLLPHVFNGTQIAQLNGDIGIGHVKYGSAKDSGVDNIQPIVTKNITGNIAIAHNGNLINSEELRTELEGQGFIFQTNADSEIILALFSKEMAKKDNIEEALTNIMKQIKGAYALTMIVQDKLIGVRDPLGLRPLVLGKMEDSYIVCSETCALDCVSADFVRDVKPGEIVIIENKDLKSVQSIDEGRSAACIFEHVYFARPDSVIDGASVYHSRFEAGRLLAKEITIDADIVVGVPDSGLASAQGYAMESGMPYSEGFIKNRYIGRTFIQPSQFLRERSVRMKLNPLKTIIKDKRVIIIDDSIVRGTTSKQMVDMIKKAGAKEIHFLVTSPPIKHSCYYGVDTPHRKHLISCTHTTEEIKELLGVDTLHFISQESLVKSPLGAKLDFCTACFDGKYPTEI